MRKLLLLSLVLFFSVANAQTFVYHPFPVANALWADETNPGSVNMQCGIFGDTVIGTTTYHKLYQRTLGCPDSSMTIANSTLIGGIREDGMKRIYFYNISYTFCAAGSSTKIYDFSKSMIGDTLQFNSPCNSHSVLTISSVDSIDISGTYRKRLHFAEGETWIEGIGSMRTL